MPLTGQRKREYQRAWVKARRDSWLKENGPCVKCGSWNDLEIDHKDAKNKAQPISSIWSRSEPARNLELKKCQVLCSACHLVKTNKEKVQTKHGTSTMHRNGCRCKKCKEHHADRMKIYRDEIALVGYSNG